MKKIIVILLAALMPLGVFAQDSTQTNVAAVPPTIRPETGNGVLRENSADRIKQKEPGICDANYRGGKMSFSNFAPMTLDDLLGQIRNRFGIGFLVGPKVGKLPVNIKADDVPWNVLLNSQLFVLGIRATCIDDRTIQLVENQALKGLQDNAELKTKFVKLKFLQPTSGGNVDLAGRSTGQGNNQFGCQGMNQNSGGQVGGQFGGGMNGCGNFELLISEIERILGIRQSNNSLGGGGTQQTETEPMRTNRSVSQVPGRNILAIRATEEEFMLINEIIDRADRPPFQVVIKGLVYTANENRLRDIGVETTITGDSGDGRTSGGIFGSTLGALGTLFDFSSLVGTFDFNVQASALQQKGVISIKSRPFAVVLDGDTTALEVGRQIPILTQGSVVGGLPGTLEFIGASNLLSVTPRVIDDEDGNPVAVNLELQIESNEVDSAVVSQGLPAVNRRSIQTRLILNRDKTVILGGFTVDSKGADVSKTPGLGDIPILGYLFKRKVTRAEVSRLYFAISVEIVPYGQVIEPVVIPGTTTEIPIVAPEMLKPLGSEEKKPAVTKPPQ